MYKRLALACSIFLFIWTFAAPYLLCQPEPQPSLVLKGNISRADFQTYKFVPFTVPDGTKRITVDFSFTGGGQKTVIDVGLFDERTFRGWGGGGKRIFTISATDASLSFLAGPIYPGEWKLLLAIPNIREGVTAEYSAKIYLARSEDASAFPFAAPVLRAGPDWFKGDLHMHTAESDGSCVSKANKKIRCPLFKTVEAASNRGLDFIAITDHNTTSHYRAIRELQPYFDNLLLMQGREITSFVGHANVFGTNAFIDFRLGQPERSINDFLQEVKRLGGVVSLNHPSVPSGELCMGCGWTRADQTDFSLVNAIEVVNGDQVESAYSGISFWEKELSKGFRLAAIAGSDNHQADLPPSATKAVGSPTTAVFANDLSEAAILEGLRRGHAYIMTEGPDGHAAHFTALQNGREYLMGDNVKAPAGSAVQFFIQADPPNKIRLEIIHNGKPVNLIEGGNPSGIGNAFKFISDGQRHWFRLNIRSASGALLTLTNPIYLNY